MTLPDTKFNALPVLQSPFRDALLHMMEEAAATLDADGRMTAVNAAMEEMFGVHQSKLLGRPLADLFIKGAAAIGESIEIGCAWEANVDVVVTGNRAETARLRLFPAFDASGTIYGWVAAASLFEKEEGSDASEDSLDPLTNLPGRTLVRARLSRAFRDSQDGDWQVTVYCVDLDGFDQINREHGRAVGDKVLMETARRIGRSMRGSNIIGRLNEDMFIVVVPDIRTQEQTIAVATRLMESIAVPYEVKGARDPLLLTASVGISVSPENGKDADALISYAQAAVELAKAGGGANFRFYTSRTGGEVRERRTRISQLRRAIYNGQLFLRYQPKVSLVTGEIVAAEALVRWQEPGSGLIMPADFVPLAEDAGLIDPLGHNVLTEACAMLRSWQDAEMPFLRLAVNVSAREIARRTFYNDLVSILRGSGIAPDSLELEITESSVMEGAEDVIRSLRDIRALGVHLTADDFGTGYSSLSYLRNFPLDGIKIDTTFVADIDNSEDGGGLASAVIAVGHCLGMNVVAEGVETKTQLSYLRWRNCDEAQGYLLSEPVSAEDFVALVRKGPILNL